MYGQYSSDARPRLSKSAMMARLPGHVRAQVASAKLAARNTLDYVTNDGVRRVRLHDTDILEIHPDGRVVVETGGWNTLTTRGRINAYAPDHVRVYTDKGIATVAAVQQGESFTWNGAAARKPFDRRAVIFPDGRIQADATADDLDVIPQLINAYVQAFKAGFPFQSSGDPWIAPGQIVARETALDWLGAGESGRSYLFDSMLFHAHVAAGLTEQGAAMHVRDYMTGRRKLDNFETGRIRRYLKRCLRA